MTVINTKAVQDLCKIVGLDYETVVDLTIKAELPGLVTCTATFWVVPPKASPEAEAKAAELVEALKNGPPPKINPPRSTKPAAAKRAKR